MGPRNGIVGDNNPTELPEFQPDEEQIKELTTAVKFVKSAEYKELKEYLDKKIEFYSTHLPTGEPVIDLEKARAMWVPANIIIAEFKGLIDAYEKAAETGAEVIKNELARRKRT